MEGCRSFLAFLTLTYIILQCVIITGSLQFNKMRKMCRHNWLNVLVKHKVVFSWSLLLPHNTRILWAGKCKWNALHTCTH